MCQKNRRSKIADYLEEGSENYIRNVMSNIQVIRYSTAHHTVIKTICQDYRQCRCSVNGGTRWLSWLRQCATSLKFAGSISDGFIGIFH